MVRHCTERCKCQLAQTCDSPLPTAGWQKFPGASVPETFNKGHVYHYLVEMLQTIDDVDDDSDIDTDSTADTFTSKPLHRGEL